MEGIALYACTLGSQWGPVVLGGKGRIRRLLPASPYPLLTPLPSTYFSAGCSQSRCCIWPVECHLPGKTGVLEGKSCLKLIVFKISVSSRIFSILPDCCVDVNNSPASFLTLEGRAVRVPPHSVCLPLGTPSACRWMKSFWLWHHQTPTIRSFCRVLQSLQWWISSQRATSSLGAHLIGKGDHFPQRATVWDRWQTIRPCREVTHSPVKERGYFQLLSILKSFLKLWRKKK